MMACEGGEVLFHSSLTVVLDGGEWLTSGLNCSLLEEQPYLVGLQNSLHVSERENISSLLTRLQVE